MISRRSFLQCSTSAVIAASLPDATSLGLKDAAPRSLLVGTVADQWQMQDTQWLALILKNFNLITLGKLKWGCLRPSESGFNFTETDWMVNCCSSHRLEMHGHNLCWNASNPSWLKQRLTKSNAARMLTEHISTVVRRYAGRITSWDVVNEPIASWMGRPDGLYGGPWLDALGPEYIDLAFHATADADPTALRVLNVAHVEQGGRGSDAARIATLRLVEALLKRNVPIQAIGFESHLAGDYPGRSTASRAAFVRALRGLGLQILLTEIDIDDTRLVENTLKRDALMADCYEDYLVSMLAEAEPKRIIFFSPGDQRNWYDAVHDSQYLRADGALHRPGLYNSSLLPKAAYISVTNALKGYRAQSS